MGGGSILLVDRLLSTVLFMTVSVHFIVTLSSWVQVNNGGSSDLRRRRDISICGHVTIIIPRYCMNQAIISRFIYLMLMTNPYNMIIKFIKCFMIYKAKYPPRKLRKHYF